MSIQLIEILAAAYNRRTLSAALYATVLNEGDDDWPTTRSKPIKKRGPNIVWPDDWDNR